MTEPTSTKPGIAAAIIVQNGRVLTVQCRVKYERLLYGQRSPISPSLFA